MFVSGFRSGCFPVNFTIPVIVPPLSSSPPTFAPTLALTFFSPSCPIAGDRRATARTAAPNDLLMTPPRGPTTTLLQRRRHGARRHLVRRHHLPHRAPGLIERVPHAVLAGDLGDVQVALLVLAARREVQLGVQQLLQLPLAPVAPLEAPEAARAPVADEVHAVERGLRPAVDAAADHADAVRRVAVLGDREDADRQPLLARLLQLDRERVDAAHLVPAVVLAALARGGLEVDLLPVVLADVRDVEVA